MVSAALPITCYPAGMIEMRMRIQYPLDVAQIDAEPSNVRFNQWNSLRYTAVNQNSTGTRSDKEDAEALRPDRPSVAIDTNGILRRGP